MTTPRYDDQEAAASSFRCVRLRLRGGTLATLRAVVPADAQAECAFVAGLSPAARFYRFHGAVNGLSDAMARYLTCVDHERHVALVATVVEGGREVVVADARYVAEGDVAEFAIAVADRFQGCGLARRLLEALVVCARRAGLRWLVGEVLTGNAAMLGLAGRLGFACSSRGVDAGVVRIECLVTALPVVAECTLARMFRRLRQAIAPAPVSMFQPF
jgi:acetyltransferase